MTLSRAMIIRWTIFLGLIALIVGLGVYLNRDVFTSPYDLAYAQDRYDFSQWTIAQSLRPIDDATLYQVAGYRLTSQWEFYTINPEVPPLGKYFYGWSIQLFGNPYIVTIPLFLLAVGLFFLIARRIFTTVPLPKTVKEAKKPLHPSETDSHRPLELAMLATVLFAAEPLLLSHLGETLLDLPQLIGAFLHMFGVLILASAGSWQMDRRGWITGITLAGIGLGWFVSVKIGFFAVVLVGSAAVLLFLKKRLLTLVPIGALAGLTYLLVYLPFFITGGSIGEFLSSQKWMLSFYLEGNDSIDRVFGTVFTMIFAGWTIGWWEDAVWDRVEEWTIFWPLLTGGALITLALSLIPWKPVTSLQKKLPIDRSTVLYLGSYLILILAALTVVPLFTRYLILLFPVVILLTTGLLALVPRQAWLIIVIGMLASVPIQLQPSLESTASAVQTHLSTNTFQDLYVHLDQKTQDTTDRTMFWRERLEDISDLPIVDQTATVTITDAPIGLFADTARATIEIVFFTPLGEIRTITTDARFIRDGASWRLEWTDDILFLGYSPTAEISVETETGQFGSLLLPDGTVVSEGTDWPFFSVIPAQVDDDRAVMEQLDQLTAFGEFEVERMYKANSIATEPQDIGFLKIYQSKDSFEMNALQPGIVVGERPTRVIRTENITDDSLSDDQLKRLEELLADNAQEINPTMAGSIVMILPDGSEEVLIESAGSDGEDVVIESIF